MFSSLTVEIETKLSFRQSAFSSSVNAHCVSPEGRVEVRGGIAEDELLVLTKCLINFQNFLLSLFSKSVIINSKLL